jgi:mRNA interferase RelE/StbE
VYRVLLHKKVEQFLDLRDDNFVLLFWDKIRVLRKNPFDRSTNLDIVSLTGKKNHFRLRIGKYRFLYEVRKSEILIYFYKADSRGGIY